MYRVLYYASFRILSLIQALQMIRYTKIVISPVNMMKRTRSRSYYKYTRLLS